MKIFVLFCRNDLLIKVAANISIDVLHAATLKKMILKTKKVVI